MATTDLASSPHTPRRSGAAVGDPVVAGVGGAGSSAAALDAVRWAADEAVARNVPLRLVHADFWPTVRMPATYAPIEHQQPHLVVSRHALDAAVRAALEAQPVVDVDGELSPTIALDLLLAESKKAALLVIGARAPDEPGGSGGMFSGALAAALVGHGHCPVAVVPAGERRTTGPVVLGVDGSPASALAATLAFETAARAGAAVIAVHAANDAAGHVPSAHTSADACDHERIVTRALTEARTAHPEVPVTVRVTSDRPVRSLLDLAGSARLVVVGARGRGGFTGMLLGSTSRALVHHCPAPVLVARAR